MIGTVEYGVEFDILAARLINQGVIIEFRMGDCDDDVFFCDDCGGIFLSTRELELHNSSEHGVPALLQVILARGGDARRLAKSCVRKSQTKNVCLRRSTHKFSPSS